MAGTNRNEKVFADAMMKIKESLNKKMLDALTNIAADLILDAEFEKEFNNLTGNTLTSYAAGVYVDRKLRRWVNIFHVDNAIDMPTSKKLSNKDGYQMVVHYDTHELIPVKTSTFVDTSDEYGYETSEKFLKSYTPEKDGYAIVMCTGTEYSAILEFGGLNVLTDTFMKSPQLFLGNLRKIKL